MANLSFQGTWADLLRGLQTLTPEQLARPIEGNTETRHFSDVSLEITTEAQYYQDGEWQGGQSDWQLWTDEERDGMERVEAGEVYLSLD